MIQIIKKMISSILIGIGFSSSFSLFFFALYQLQLNFNFWLFAVGYGIFCGIVSFLLFNDDIDMPWLNNLIAIPIHCLLILIGFIVFCKLFTFTFYKPLFIFCSLYFIIYVLCWAVNLFFDHLETEKINRILSTKNIKKE